MKPSYIISPISFHLFRFSPCSLLFLFMLILSEIMRNEDIFGKFQFVPAREASTEEIFLVHSEEVFNIHSYSINSFILSFFSTFLARFRLFQLERRVLKKS